VVARLVRAFILRLVRLFYPRIEVRGLEHLPRSGPVIFVLNHPNGLLDPMVLIIATGRLVRFLAKSTFFGNPVGRMMMSAFGVLPVYRQRDEGQAGGPQGDAVDRNEETFARCRELLRRGWALALFPEGTTHSGSMLLPLRTGAARIALSAEAEAGWKLGLQVVPVGLWYQSKTIFRTAALVVIGQSFDLAEFAPAYTADPRQAVKELTDRIDARLDTVVLQAENAQ
jgi:1-acyl-sn-glycerol-3-phosphate acyltransferase